MCVYVWTCITILMRTSVSFRTFKSFTRSKGFLGAVLTIIVMNTRVCVCVYVYMYFYMCVCMCICV